MSDDSHFFLRDHWEYDPTAPKHVREDAGKGIDTKSLHSGFHPYQNQNDFRLFTPPLVQSVTYPYETFDKIPCPVYGRTRPPTNTVLEERLASLEGGESCITAGSGSCGQYHCHGSTPAPHGSGSGFCTAVYFKVPGR
ncbi:MAG: hypothetical protein DRH93_13180 [Deltaproteobacteria bacterium]|nr:MAG: hypothetical protein DRH93_13180 [Deltaproteobacteria bacterium]